MMASPEAMLLRLMHNGVRWRGHQLLRPAGHHYQYRYPVAGRIVFECRCHQRWHPETQHGHLTRYDTFARYRAEVPR
jgi:hypothetical protein